MSHQQKMLQIGRNTLNRATQEIDISQTKKTQTFTFPHIFTHFLTVNCSFKQTIDKKIFYKKDV